MAILPCKKSWPNPANAGTLKRKRGARFMHKIEEIIPQGLGIKIDINFQ